VKLSDLRVLLIEDEPEALELTAMMLEEYVGKVYRACDGVEGWALYRMLRPDLVLSDIRMPRMDGLELAKKIKEDNPSQPILFLSAHNDSDTLMRAMELSVENFVLKPIQIDVLIDRIVKVVSKYHHGLEDQVRLAKRAKKLEGIAYFDQLTGIPNRFAFQEELQRRILWERDEGVTLLYLDLNDLKTINDRYGHGMGDRYILAFSQRVLTVAEEHFFARIGGDEFSMLMKGKHSCDALKKFALQIEEAFNEPIVWEDEKIYLSCSVGAARFPDDAQTQEDLLHKADLAMYRAKAHIKATEGLGRRVVLACAEEI